MGGLVEGRAAKLVFVNVSSGAAPNPTHFASDATGFVPSPSGGWGTEAPGDNPEWNWGMDHPGYQAT